MNLKLLAFIPGMVLAGLAHGQVRSASVIYTYRESPSQQAYRLGDECFVPLDVLTGWGWKVAKQGDSVNLSLEGHTVHLDTRYVSGKVAIPLRKAISEVGGSSSWTAGTDTLNVFSVISELSIRDLRVHAESGLPFKSTSFYLSPGKTVIDLVGVRLGTDTHEDFSDDVKAVQYRPNQVRLTVTTPFVPKLPEGSDNESTVLDYRITKDQDLAEVRPEPNRVVLSNPPHLQVAHPQSDGPVKVFPPVNQIMKAPTTQVVTPPGTAQSLNISVESETETATAMGIHLPNAFAGKITFIKTDPATLEIDFPVAAQLPSPDYTVAARSIESVSVEPSGSGSRLLIHLVRSMGTEVIPDDTGATVNFYQPRGSDSKLQGKVIVVDPGHGGHDRGAHSSDVNEKDLNLSIGLKVAQRLSAAGATVILTRRDDTFIPLGERSAISNRNHADFFISCHINSTGGSADQSGTITFHHKGNKISKFLAECIQDQLRRVNGLPNKGAMSDGVLYYSGLSVLRLTYAPAVLIEMGFINNARDRNRMVTQDFQDSVSKAVVKGLRVYLGEIKPNE